MIEKLLSEVYVLFSSLYKKLQYIDKHKKMQDILVSF